MPYTVPFTPCPDCSPCNPPPPFSVCCSNILLPNNLHLTISNSPAGILCGNLLFQGPTISGSGVGTPPPFGSYLSANAIFFDWSFSCPTQGFWQWQWVVGGQLIFAFPAIVSTCTQFCGVGYPGASLFRPPWGNGTSGFAGTGALIDSCNPFQCHFDVYDIATGACIRYTITI